MQKAPKLMPGDTIAVIAPASAPKNPDVYERGFEALSERGYEVIRLRENIERHGYLADTDAVRIAEINEAIRRPDVKAIFCVRGGYGTPRLLPYLDYEAAALHPKVLVGYSDITALHWALYQKAGWQGLSGHLVVEWADLDAPSEQLFWDWLNGVETPDATGPHGEQLTPMRKGTAEGVLLGGNLTLMAALIGTPYMPDLKGAILFIEEVGEKPYSVDRMLMHFKLAGLLDELGGVVLAGFTEGETAAPTLTFDQVFEDYFGQATYPVARDLHYGHWETKLCMPVGLRARLTVTDNAAQLTYLEPLTV